MTAHASFSPTANRIYIRKFDHDDCRTRYAAGESIASLMRRYDVAYGSVRRVIDPAFREALDARAKAFYAGVCSGCGAPCLGSRHPSRHQARDLCKSCAHKADRVCVRLDENGSVLLVRCFACKEWKPPEVFGRGRRYPDLREGGFHNGCRACNSSIRRDYRERNKISCEGGCGRQVEGKGRANTNEGGGGGRHALDPGRPHLCTQCWHASPEGRAAQAKSVEAARARGRRGRAD